MNHKVRTVERHFTLTPAQHAKFRSRQNDSQLQVRARAAPRLPITQRNSHAVQEGLVLEANCAVAAWVAIRGLKRRRQAGSLKQQPAG